MKLNCVLEGLFSEMRKLFA